jgi:hypothetical protein
VDLDGPIWLTESPKEGPRSPLQGQGIGSLTDGLKQRRQGHPIVAIGQCGKALGEAALLWIEGSGSLTSVESGRHPSQAKEKWQSQQPDGINRDHDY